MISPSHCDPPSNCNPNDAGSNPTRVLSLISNRCGSVTSRLRGLFKGGVSSLTVRIILTNFGGLLILAIGLLYFNQSRDSLIDARVQSLMTQARLMAAAVASSASIDTGEIIINPESLLQQGVAAREDGQTAFLLGPEDAGPVLRRLAKSSDTRARIYDREGLMLVDTEALYQRGDILKRSLAPPDKPHLFSLKRLFLSLRDWFYANDYPMQANYGLENGRDFPEINAALNGASASVVRKAPGNGIAIAVAVPIQRFRAVLGVLLLSSEDDEIGTVLRKERHLVLLTFLIAALAAVFLSVVMASQLAGPIKRLASAAEGVRRAVDNRAEIPDLTGRRDEIGHLSGTLRAMTKALYDRIDAIEAFAADVSHELKNPLTSLRSAVETLSYAHNEEQRARLLAIIADDVRRLDRLISDIADASRLDAELSRARAKAVDMAELLKTLAGLNDKTHSGAPHTMLTIEPPPPGMATDMAFKVSGHDVRLGQVVRNLLDNAASFSPPGGLIRLTLRRVGEDIRFTVEDEGPGLKPDQLERIFERFYTDRPETAFGKNSGLGLSITRQIVEAHQGVITAQNIIGTDPDGPEAVIGARFEVRLPAMTAQRNARINNARG